MRKKKNEITEDFKRKLMGFLPELSRNNHYIMFLHDCISREFDIQLAQIQSHNAVSDETKEPVDLVGHPFPLSNEEIQFLPMFMDTQDPAYKKDMDEFMSWVSKGRDPVAFFKMTKDYYAQKKSWVVQKILSLSEDFVKELIKISEEENIPLPSLHNMYILMTGINDFFQSQANHALLPAFLHYPVPVSVSPDQRDDRIISVWKRLYNLLVECYWAVIVVGMVDMLNIVGNYQEEGLEEARNYLMHSVIYSDLESQVLLIKNTDDLRGYVQKEFSVFESFFPDFGEFVRQAVIPIVEKRERILNYPITPLIDSESKKEFYDPKKGKVVKSQTTPLTAYKNKPQKNESLYNPEAEMIDHLRRQELRKLFVGKIKSKTKSVDSGSGEEIIEGQRDQEESSKKVPVLMESTVIEDFEKKVGVTGLLKTYRLTGNPDKMIHYLFKIISNVSWTITDKIYSKKLNDLYGDGMSSVTFRRWRRKIRKGEIQLTNHPDRPSGVRSFNDLFEGEVIEIMRDMKDRQEHHKEGYFTQNELIKAIQGDTFRLALRRKYGISLKKYGRTKLRNMLNTLINEKKITFERERGATYFKISDGFKIVQEIAKLSSK